MSPATSITAATVLAVALAAFPVAIDRDTGMPGAKLSVAQEAAEEDHPDDDADHDEDHDEATDGDHPDDDADHDEATDGDHPDDDADHPPDAPDDPPPDEPPEDEPPPDDPPPDDPPADEPPPPDEPLPVELPGEIGPAAPPVEEFGGLEALLDLAPDVAAALVELGMTMNYCYKSLSYVPSLSNLSSRLDNSVPGMALNFARPDAANVVRLAAAV